MNLPLKNKIKNHFYRLNNGIPVGTPIHSDETNEKIPVSIPNRYWLHLLLFILTFAATTFAGAHSGDSWLTLLSSGLSYSITLLTIITFHEFGHYFAARHFGVTATLPFYIPFLTWPGTWIGFGTLGAVIKTRSPITNRRALLYIGAMGPLAGFAISIAALYIGLLYSDIAIIPPVSQNIPVRIYGDSLLLKAVVYLIHGPIPEGYDVFLSPVAWAGWIGFLLTSLNLMPLGQLDGGHILYALIGRKQRFAGWTALVILSALSFLFHGWVLWIILTLTFLMVAHPPVPEGDPLTTNEKIMGWFCMIILFLTFIPVPVSFIQPA